MRISKQEHKCVQNNIVNDSSNDKNDDNGSNNKNDDWINYTGSKKNHSNNDYEDMITIRIIMTNVKTFFLESIMIRMAITISW